MRRWGVSGVISGLSELFVIVSPSLTVVRFFFVSVGALGEADDP
jgi:phage shock protein PspC (stress-responsive transcriptional regulator)